MVSMLVFFTTTLYAQQEVEMADTMRAEGKIYVIVGIILIVLAGLFVYLFLLDRKLKRIEEQLKKERRQAT
jgi:CcmD family protein